MIWKLLSLQHMLDALFDDGWCNLWLPEGHDTLDAPLIDWQ